MMRTFKDQGTEDIFDGKNSKIARKLCPRDLWRIAARKLEQIDSATVLDDLKVPQEIVWKRYQGIAMVSTVLELTISTVFVLDGTKVMLNKSK